MMDSSRYFGAAVWKLHARANPDQGYGESEHAHYRPQIPL